jgi:hypothetical protein
MSTNTRRILLEPACWKRNLFLRVKGGKFNHQYTATRGNIIQPIKTYYLLDQRSEETRITSWACAIFTRRIPDPLVLAPVLHPGSIGLVICPSPSPTVIYFNKDTTTSSRKLGKPPFNTPSHHPFTATVATTCFMSITQRSSI